MTTPTLTPARGFVHPNFDQRPCVTKPPQWWDLGDDHNPRAIRYCRNVCPLRTQCLTTAKTAKPKGQIRGGNAYNEYGKRVAVCRHCDHPRMRKGSGGPIICGCPSRAERAAEREAQRQAKAAARQAAAAQKGPVGVQLVDVWLPLANAGLSNKEAARRLGVRYGTLKNALHRARAAGDRRVPYFRSPRKSVRTAA